MDDIFKHSAFFAGIAGDELDQLELPIKLRHYEDGDIVFEEGAVGQNVYLVASGEVSISKRGRGGKQEILTVKKPGDFFGELALLLEDEQHRTARATAKGATVLGTLGRDGLHAMMGHSPEAALHFTRLIASQLKRANTHFIDELIDAERLSLIGTMMGAMVHDFRNPIATISMASHYLKSNTEDEALVTMGELTSDATDQMLVMIQEVLDYSKGEIKLELKATSVTELLESIDTQILNSLANDGITVIREIDYEGDIVADRNRLIRLLCNIIKNGSEAMEAGGTLTLRVGGASDDSVWFEVEDNGCGIPDKVLEQIFEPFVTYGKASGTGLGMAIVRSVVDAHKGDIRISSEEGKGTTCRIDLPRDASGPGSKKEQQ
nr:two-component system sensor histidine kinase [uncultured bacterium]